MFDFVGGLTAFWTLRAYGPRFLFKILMEFAGGRYFPLAILPFGLAKVVSFSPFAFILYWPAVYLTEGKVYEGYGVYALIWIALLGFLLHITWKKGLKVYEAYGG